MHIDRCMKACALSESRTTLLRGLAMLRNLLDTYSRVGVVAAGGGTQRFDSLLLLHSTLRTVHCLLLVCS
jgi:hypothetical protein